MPIRNCPEPCDVHYACRLRQNKSMIMPSSTPSRFKHGKIRKMVEPSWEKGIPTEKRPGGFEMPYLRPDGSKMRIKEFTQRRREIEATRDRQRNAPANP